MRLRNIANTSASFRSIPWPTVFTTGLSSLWHCRNNFVFQGKALSSQELCFSVISRAGEFHNHLLTPTTDHVPKTISTYFLIAWNFPPFPFIKCNVDGSVRDGGLAACGCLFRDSSGTWIDGFVRNVGVASITMTELWGILSALQKANSLGTSHLWIEVDSMTAVSLALNGCSNNHPCFPIVSEIRNLEAGPWQVHISHNFREANRAADWLASHAFNFPIGLHAVHDPPSQLIPILRDDIVGVAFLRNSPL
ncbi:Ribonuclease H domain [Sesbania bispinosa]|nr:Ribonuclease H domain [Sesbania bispinosa]